MRLIDGGDERLRSEIARGALAQATHLAGWACGATMIVSWGNRR